MTDRIITSLDKLLDIGEKFAREMLLVQRAKQLIGHYHLIGPEKDVVIATSWSNDIEKQLVLLHVKEQSRKIKATQALCVHEAWMLKLNVPQTPDTPWHRRQALEQARDLPRPSESPDRIEVVQMMAMDAKTVLTRSLQIIRDKPGGRIIALIEDKGLGQAGAFSGRMVEGIIEAPPEG